MCNYIFRGAWAAFEPAADASFATFHFGAPGPDSLAFLDQSAPRMPAPPQFSQPQFSEPQPTPRTITRAPRPATPRAGPLVRSRSRISFSP